MKITLVLGVLFGCLLIGCIGNAQSIRLLDATRQDWAGGVAGWHGTNYLIEIQTSDYNLVPDTVWMNAMPFALDSGDAEARLKKSIDTVHHTITYTIAAYEGYHSNVSADHFSLNPIHGEYHVAIKQYTGAALVTYMYKHKQCSFLVKEFRTLPGLNYP